MQRLVKYNAKRSLSLMLCLQVTARRVIIHRRHVENYSTQSYAIARQ